MGSYDLNADEPYVIRISNDTGSGSELIMIDDFLITSSGDWTITSDCVLETSDNAPGNVRVEDGITLTISSGVTLDMDLSSYHLSIGDGSRVVIETGAKIN